MEISNLAAVHPNAKIGKNVKRTHVSFDKKRSDLFRLFHFSTKNQINFFLLS